MRISNFAVWELDHMTSASTGGVLVNTTGAKASPSVNIVKFPGHAHYNDTPLPVAGADEHVHALRAHGAPEPGDLRPGLGAQRRVLQARPRATGTAAEEGALLGAAEDAQLVRLLAHKSFELNGRSIGKSLRDSFF